MSVARILVIEDEDHIRESIEDTLSYAGYSVMAAANGAEGVSIARMFKPHLILCDVMMPLLDGYGVLLQLSQSPETASISFVFLTALSSYDDIRKGMSMGADDYLIKPFSAQQLLDTVRTRLERRQMLDKSITQQMENIREYINLTLPHELRTPLTGLLGYIYMLRDGYERMDHDAIQKMFNGLERSADRLRVLVENFMAYSQLHVLLRDEELCAKVLQYSNLRNFREVILHQAEQESHRAGRYQDLTTHLDPGRILIYYDHAAKLASCIINNAFKFSESGTVVRVVGKALEDHYLLTITNHGRGMTPEQIASIGVNRQFERDQYEQQGAGLGLIIANQIAMLYNGEMTIESTPGEKTVVSVRLQYAPSEVGLERSESPN